MGDINQTGKSWPTAYKAISAHLASSKYKMLLYFY